jgi:trk system potassium uptake protein TrkA
VARGHGAVSIAAEVVQPLSDELTEVLILDATDVDALRSVDIALYDAVVVAINEDFEDELLATLSLKSLGVKRVVGVASDERQKTILLKIGADEVVMPEHDSGERLGLLLSLPNLVERVALGQEHSIAEMRMPKGFADRTVEEVNFTATYHVTLLAIKRKGELIMPGPRLLLYSDDLMVVVGQDDDVAHRRGRVMARRRRGRREGWGARSTVPECRTPPSARHRRIAVVGLDRHAVAVGVRCGHAATPTFQKRIYHRIGPGCDRPVRHYARRPSSARWR